MKAGREMDVLVGRNVMNDPDLGVLIPEYSTRIGAAWRIVERFMRHGIVRVSNGNGDSYDCDFIPRDGGLGGYQGASAGGSEGRTVSIEHAICLCALRALGIEP